MDVIIFLQVVGIELKPRPCLMVSVEIPISLRGRLKKMKVVDKQKFLDSAGRRLLGRDSVILFVTNGEVKHVGVVSRREASEFSSIPDQLLFGVSLFEDSTTQFLSSLQGCNGKNERFRQKVSDCIFQASASLFSYEPVLRRLQQMTAIHFSEQLCRQQNPTLLPDDQLISIPEDISEKLSADPSQLEAVQNAVNHNLSMIWGPPGTGKTFAGVQIVKSLVEKATSENRPRILVMCYTNHALDSFLESLMDAGVREQSIVRLGSSPKISERLQKRALRDLSETSFSRYQSSRFATQKRRQEASLEMIEKNKQYLQKREWGPKWWRTASGFLRYGSDEHRAALDELSSPTEKSKDGDELWNYWCRGRNIDGTNFKTDKFGRIVTVASKSSATLIGEIEHMDVHSSSIWNLSLKERRELMNQWASEYRMQHLKILAEAMTDYEDASNEIDILRSETKLEALRGAVLVGCTTTSAAKHNDILSSYAPTTVLVEEAAEILEAHVLTTLHDSVQRLILIGDHFQLRPKLEHYPLRKESGQHVNFDESLFERLALQHGFPISLLNIQHRMRPEISSLVRRTTYPTLQDHPSVFGRPNILGLSNNVVFLAHNHNESLDEEKAALGTSSKVNKYEADMVIEIVRYLLKQGYNTSDIVVLTPYLGQLVLIQSCLVKNMIGCQLGDLDRGELARAAVDLASIPNEAGGAKPSAVSNEQKSSIRVATVDNFQGIS